MKNAQDSGIMKMLVRMAYQLARTALTTSAIALGVLGTLIGEATSVLNVKKARFTIPSLEIASLNAVD